MNFLTYRGKNLYFWSINKNEPEGFGRIIRSYYRKGEYVPTTNLLKYNAISKNEIFRKFEKFHFKESLYKNHILIGDFNIQNLDYGDFVCFNITNTEIQKGFFIWSDAIDIKNKKLVKEVEMEFVDECEYTYTEIYLVDFKIDKMLKATNYKDKNGNIIFEDDATIIEDEIYFFKEGNLVTDNGTIFKENSEIIKEGYIDYTFYRCISTKDF